MSNLEDKKKEVWVEPKLDVIDFDKTLSGTDDFRVEGDSDYVPS